jgi:hypothetical protein
MEAPAAGPGVVAASPAAEESGWRWGMEESRGGAWRSPAASVRGALTESCDLE